MDPIDLKGAALFLDIDNVLATEATHDAEAARRGITRRELVSLPLDAEMMRRLLDPGLVARVQGVCSGASAGFVLVSTWVDLFEVDETAAPDRFREMREYRRHADAVRRAHVEALVGVLREHGLAAPYLGCAPQPVYKMSDYHGRNAHRRTFIRRCVEDLSTPWCVLDDDSDGVLYGYRHRGAGRRYFDPLFEGHCVHPKDGVTEVDAAACLAILRGGQ